MSKIDHTKLYKTQVSQTEWFKAIDHPDTEAFRVEDNEKRERLKRLNELIGMPFDRPHQFTATDIVERPPAFIKFLEKHGSELCALRLIPLEEGLPKLRMRGHTIQGSLVWFAEQDIDHTKYRADFVPHCEVQNWATIFIVNGNGAFGEIIPGSHAQLTQGFYEDQPPIRFSWDFKEFKLVPDNPDAKKHLQTIFKWLHVTDPSISKQIASEFGAKFTQDYLHGYFETTDSDAFGLWFIDYNRVLGNLYADYQEQKATTGHVLVSGQTGSPGKSKGRVRIVSDHEGVTLGHDEILVCQMTTPDYLPLMRQSVGIVTDFGGILSHAAIVARELGIPCITAAGNATSVLREGLAVEVDANSGVVREALPIQYVATKAIIVKAGKVLLLKQNPDPTVSNANRYLLPGGIVEPGETLHDAVVRECAEEAGLQVDVGEQLAVHEWPSNIRGVDCQFFGVFFVCHLVGRDDITLDIESTEFKWIEPEDLDNYDIPEPTLGVIKKALSGLSYGK